MTGAWEHDWKRKITSEVQFRGFDSLFDFMRANEVADFTTIAKELGNENESLAPVQIEKVFRKQANERNEQDYFVKSCLVRRLNHFTPLGFQNHGIQPLAHALSSWGGMVGMTKQLERMCSEVVTQFRRRKDIDASWLPSSVADPILGTFFQKYDLTSMPLENEGD